MSGFEEVRLIRGARSGAAIAIAVHSTALGPALGGARIWSYPDTGAAVADAKRLARAMTLKAAAAGLDLGGGKGVIAAPGGERPQGDQRRALLLDFGDLVDSLGGSYITAEDVGTGAADMEVIAEQTEHVVGRAASSGGSGDPSPLTALGVLSAMRASAERAFGERRLAGLRVAVIGLGHVGSELARLLAAERARLIVTDIDPSRRRLAERLGARWVSPERILPTECELLAPCALGGIIGPGTVEELRCRVVCGAANNVLATPRTAVLLDRRGIIYAPDFIANAGGLINVYAEHRELGAAWARDRILAIETRMTEVLADAEQRRSDTLAAAQRLALSRVERSRPQPAIAAG
jgi:leucine dehydrogenase